jgi:hypothetical protein
MSALRWTAVSGTSTPRRCAAAVPSLDRRVEPAITLWQAGSDTRPSRIHHGAARGTKASSPAGTAGGRDGEGHPLGSRITRRTTWSAAQNPSMSHPSHDIVLGRVNRRVMAGTLPPSGGGDPDRRVHDHPTGPVCHNVMAADRTLARALRASACYRPTRCRPRAQARRSSSAAATSSACSSGFTLGHTLATLPSGSMR